LNNEFRPIPLISAGDKHRRGFVSDICGKLLCPAEWSWEDPVYVWPRWSSLLDVADMQSSIRAGIRDRTTAFIVSENSWPLFMYQNCEADANNLEHGLMKSKLLVMVSILISLTESCLIEFQGFKAIFTSPSSANEVDGEGEGADIIENNRRAQRQSDQTKVKTCVASIIGMRKVTARAIAYAACQVGIDAYL
jgi:hypothetical protein